MEDHGKDSYDHNDVESFPVGIAVPVVVDATTTSTEQATAAQLHVLSVEEDEHLPKEQELVTVAMDEDDDSHKEKENQLNKNIQKLPKKYWIMGACCVVLVLLVAAIVIPVVLLQQNEEENEHSSNSNENGNSNGYSSSNCQSDQDCRAYGPESTCAVRARYTYYDGPTSRDCCSETVTLDDGVTYCAGIEAGLECQAHETCISGACAITKDELWDDVFQPKHCCPDNATVQINGKEYCAALEGGESCQHASQCAVGFCGQTEIENDDTICCWNRISPVQLADGRVLCSNLNLLCSTDDDCGDVGNVCGLTEYDSMAMRMCCPSGEAVAMPIAGAPDSQLMDNYCTKMEMSSKCLSDEMCADDLVCRFYPDYGPHGHCCGDEMTLAECNYISSGGYVPGIECQDPYSSCYGQKEGACGFEEYTTTFGTSPQICCPSNETLRINDADFCTELGVGQKCGDSNDSLCASGNCQFGYCAL